MLNDSATLSGGINPTGTITFRLFGVNDQTCGGAPIFTNTVPVAGNGVYNTTAGFTTVAAGTYHWTATYSGDASNTSVSSICANEAVVISSQLTINTLPNPLIGPIGTVLNDRATLAGGVNPTGTITFRLFGVNDQTCSVAPIFTNTVPVSGAGTYNTSAGFTAVLAGTYHWTATYSGDANNSSVSSICANEAVVIIPRLTLVTIPNPGSGPIGTVLNDCATLTGGSNPSGTITFRLFGVNDQTCSAAAIFTNTVPVNSGAGTYCTSAGYTTVEAGTYHWQTTYSGDANNSSLTDPCVNEPVVIGNPPPGEEGESPYIGIVGNDIAFNPFYFSPKHQQFLYDQTLFDVPVCFGTFPPVVPQTRLGGTGCEQFRSNTPLNQPEICDTTGVVNGVGDFSFFGEPNAVIRKDNAGYYEWYIRLPKKPNGQINVVFQCGVLKPNTFAFEEFNAVRLCAAETGERIGTGFCTSNQVAPNTNPIINSSLPKITAIAYPGPYAPVAFTPFHLTAYKNPGNYNLTIGTNGAMTNNASLQVLDGSANARIMLKACLDKTVITKIPVTGQINVLGEEEFDLEAGDLIQVRIDVPVNNKVDIYCSPQSVRLAGIAEGPF